VLTDLPHSGSAPGIGVQVRPRLRRRSFGGPPIECKRSARPISSGSLCHKLLQNWHRRAINVSFFSGEVANESLLYKTNEAVIYCEFFVLVLIDLLAAALTVPALGTVICDRCVVTALGILCQGEQAWNNHFRITPARSPQLRSAGPGDFWILGMPPVRVRGGLERISYGGRCRFKRCHGAMDDALEG
jgi:hypothetical protein